VSVWTGRVSAKQRGIPPAGSELNGINKIPSMFVAGGDDAATAPRVVHLGGDVPEWLAKEFPPVERGYSAGLLGSSWLEANNLCAAAELVYGIGAVTHTVFADWRPGAYQLPPCQSVRVSVRVWGLYWAEASIDQLFSATVVDGTVPDLHPLTFTARTTLDAGASRSIHPPPHARSYEVTLHAGEGASNAGPVVLGQGAQRQLVDGSTLFPVPPTNVTGQEPLQLLNAGADAVDVALTFYLAP
jgi:hypothetical protein